MTVAGEAFVDGGCRTIKACVSKREKVVGYMLSLDARDKLVRVDATSVHDLAQHGNTLTLPSAALSVVLTYEPQYLETRPAKRMVACWYHPPCGCCSEDAEYEFDKDEEEHKDAPLPGYIPKGDPFTRHAVEGPTVWVLSKIKPSNACVRQLES